MADPAQSSESRDAAAVTVPARRVRRREVMKGTVSVATGVAAAGYVSPALQGLGVPATLAASAPPPPPTVQQGCSPGYYKTGHPGAVYVPNITFGAAFSLTGTVCGVDTTQTLAQILDNPGGGAAQALAFQASAAYVNSIRGINYPLTTTQLVSDVQVAFSGCDNTTMSNEASSLDTFNNLEGSACS